MRKFAMKGIWLALVASLLAVGFPQPVHAEICDLGLFIVTFEYAGCPFGLGCSVEACIGRVTGTVYIIEETASCGCNKAA